jgi:phosphohistidine phosphatase
MKLCIVRHAIAADPVEGQRDSARPLTPAGQRKFAAAAKGLARLDVRFEVVLHSPLLRAVETADLLRELVDDELHVTGMLARAPTKGLLDALDAERMALVGHEPYVSELVAWLVTGDRELARAFPFKKGGVALLEGAPKPGEMFLTGFLSPAQLRAIGKKR